jgi:hypothetical protein
MITFCYLQYATFTVVCAAVTNMPAAGLPYVTKLPFCPTYSEADTVQYEVISVFQY